MRKTHGTVSVLRGNELHGPGLRGPASYKGQLFLDEVTGDYYKSLDAGRSVEFELVPGMSSSGSSNVTVSEDPDHPGFAVIH